MQKRITGFPVIDDDWKLVIFLFFLLNLSSMKSFDENLPFYILSEISVMLLCGS